MALLAGQENFEAGMARLAVNVNEAAIAFHDPDDGGEPEPGALADLFRGKKRIENLVDDMPGDAGAVIGDLNQNMRARPARPPSCSRSAHRPGNFRSLGGDSRPPAWRRARSRRD